jgi:ribonuclease R
MIGADTGQAYPLGDAVTVRLVEAAPVAGALRFELLSEGRHGVRRSSRVKRAQERKAGRERRKKRA